MATRGCQACATTGTDRASSEPAVMLTGQVDRQNIWRGEPRATTSETEPGHRVTASRERKLQNRGARLMACVSPPPSQTGVASRALVCAAKACAPGTCTAGWFACHWFAWRGRIARNKRRPCTVRTLHVSGQAPTAAGHAAWLRCATHGTCTHSRAAGMMWRTSWASASGTAAGAAAGLAAGAAPPPPAAAPADAVAGGGRGGSRAASAQPSSATWGASRRARAPRDDMLYA